MLRVNSSGFRALVVRRLLGSPQMLDVLRRAADHGQSPYWAVLPLLNDAFNGAFDVGNTSHGLTWKGKRHEAGKAIADVMDEIGYERNEDRGLMTYSKKA